jgi:hypothetical protein
VGSNNAVDIKKKREKMSYLEVGVKRILGCQRSRRKIYKKRKGREGAHYHSYYRVRFEVNRRGNKNVKSRKAWKSKRAN